MTLGLQSSTQGVPVGVARLEVLNVNGLKTVRIEAGPDPAAAAQEVRTGGGDPHVIAFTLDELRALTSVAVDLANEPNLAHNGWTQRSYNAFVREAIPVAQENGLTLYIGVVANLDDDGLNFLRGLPWADIPEWVRIAVHSYPTPGLALGVGHDGRSRDEEVAELKAIIGGRRFGVTEVGYNGVDFTRAQIVEAFAWEREFWTRHGADCLIAYQMIDGPIVPEDDLDEKRLKSYGFTTVDGEWKRDIVAAFTGRPFVMPGEAPEPPPAPEPVERVYDLPVDISDGPVRITGSLRVAVRTAVIDPPPPPPPPPRERLTVTVLDAGTDGSPDPIPGARVFDGALEHVAGADGVASFDVDGPGVYRVSAEHFVPKDVDLPPGDHRVHLELAQLPHPAPLRGRLRLKDRIFLDDSGPVLPLFCHFGEAFSAFTRKRDLVLRQLDVIASAGYHGLRFWDVLGYYDAGWSGREVTPFSFKNKSGGRVDATSNYYVQLRDFLLACAERRLTVMHDRGDLNAWSDRLKFDHMGSVGALYRELGEVGRQVLAGKWAVNEAAHNGVTDPKVAIEMIRAFERSAGWLPDVVGLSDYDQTEELASLRAWSVDPATVVTIHALRDPGNDKRMIEHYFTDGYGACQMIGKAGWMTEPIGGGDGVSVGQENDPDQLVMLAAASLVAGQAWTHMSGNGVFWNGPLRVKGARVTKQLLEDEGEQLAVARASQDWDFTKHQPGFLEVPRAVAKLPRDVMRWTTLHHSGVNFRGTRVFIANDHARADGRMNSDGQCLYLLYQEGGGVPSLPIERQAQIDTVFTSPKGSIVRGRVLSGQRFQSDDFGPLDERTDGEEPHAG